jgi:asparagine synthase (glutamine-hydrolysing)
VLQRRLSPTARQVQAERLTYLASRKILQLETAMQQLGREQVPGAFIECGVALGGSAVLLARTALAQGRSFDGYDVFGTIPPPTERDPPDVHERYRTIISGQSQGIGSDEYYGYRTDLYEHVTSVLERFGAPVGPTVHLHKGLFEDTLQVSEPVALAHLDCDWYEPVHLCIERIYPQLSHGGQVVIDDYHDYSGARDATDEMLAAHPDLRVSERRSHLIIRRD